MRECTCDARFSGLDENEYRARGCPSCTCEGIKKEIFGSWSEMNEGLKGMATAEAHIKIDELETELNEYKETLEQVHETNKILEKENESYMNLLSKGFEVDGYITNSNVVGGDIHVVSGIFFPKEGQNE